MTGSDPYYSEWQVENNVAISSNGICLDHDLTEIVIDPDFTAFDPTVGEEVVYKSFEASSAVYSSGCSSLYGSALTVEGKEVIVAVRAIDDTRSTIRIEGTETNNDVWSPSVLHDGERFQMWYLAGDRTNGSQSVHHRTSYDGLHWFKEGTSSLSWSTPSTSAISVTDHNGPKMYLEETDGNGSFFSLDHGTSNVWSTMDLPSIEVTNDVTASRLIVSDGELSLIQTAMDGYSMSEMVSKGTIAISDVHTIIPGLPGEFYIVHGTEPMVTKGSFQYHQRGYITTSLLDTEPGRLEMDLMADAPAGCDINVALLDRMGNTIISSRSIHGLHSDPTIDGFLISLGPSFADELVLNLSLRGDGSATPVLYDFEITSKPLYPNLNLEQMTVEAFSRDGADKAWVNVTISNVGERSMASSFHLDIQLDGSLMERHTIAPLLLDDTIQYSYEIDITTGLHTVTALCDPLDLVIETDESDNSMNQQLEVGTGGDLALAPTVTFSPDEFERYDLVDVTFTVRMVGVTTANYDLTMVCGSTMFVDRNVSQDVAVMTITKTWMVGIEPPKIDVSASIANITIDDQCSMNNKMSTTVIIDRSPKTMVSHVNLTIQEDIPSVDALDASELFSDDGLLLYGMSGGGNVFTEISPLGKITFVSKPNWYGEENLTLWCKDASDKEASLTIHITCEPVNDPPVFNTDQVEIWMSSNTTELDLSRMVSDVDNDTSDLVFSFSDGGQIKGSTAVMYLSNDEMSGSYELVVSDGELTDELDVQLRRTSLMFLTVLSPVANERIEAGSTVRAVCTSSVDTDQILTVTWSIDGQVVAYGMDTPFTVPSSVGPSQVTVELVAYGVTLSADRGFTVVAPSSLPVEDNDAPLAPPIVGGSLILVTVIVGVAWFAMGEKMRWKLLGMLLAPLYSQLKREDVESQVTRKRILDYIKVNEGANFNTIKTDLNFNNGTLSYHLAVLERNKIITSRRAGKYRLFYSVDYGLIDVLKGFSKTQKKLIYTIDKNPGITQMDLSEKAGLTRSTTCKNLKLIQERRVVKTVIKGNFRHYYIRDETISDHWSQVNKKNIKISDFENLEKRWKKEAELKMELEKNGHKAVNMGGGTKAD